MEIVIERSSRTPLYRQIADKLGDMIRSGALPTGFKLPPERRLADALGVNRTTVLTAYRKLKAAGLVDAHVGRGTIVRAVAPAPTASPGQGIPWQQLFRDGLRRFQDPLLRDLLELAEHPEVISLSIGLPAPELLPMQTLGEIFNSLVEKVGAALLQHCPTEGHTPLRDTLAQRCATRGIRCATDEVLILSGSQQGLDLLGRVFLDPGDPVIVEEPTYIGALEVFRCARARIVGIPIDADGMRTDILEDVLGRVRPKLIYTLPTFQNPSGAVMSIERRRHLLELAARHRVPVVEDDPYSELRYNGDSLPSLAALDQSKHVLHLSTFSKVLFPGMRIGYLIAPRPVMRQLVLAKQGVDLHANSLGQWLLDCFVVDGWLEPHLQSLRSAYARRRDAMVHALESAGSPALTWNRPEGGFYVWCRLPDNVQPSPLLTHAAKRGVAFLPGNACFSEDPQAEYARLNFSYPTTERIAEGIRRFVDAVHQTQIRSGASRTPAETTSPVV